MNYLKVHPQLPYEIVVFTEAVALEEYIHAGNVEIILSGDEEVLQIATQSSVRRVLQLLEEPEMTEAENNYCRIFKYQSAAHILKEMTNYCLGNVNSETNALSKQGGAKILGIYSPVGRCGKTTFSLSLAQVLGKGNKVLYINLEEYSGLTEGVLREGLTSLSEIMYLFRRGTGGLADKINEATVKEGNFNYISPMPYPEDVAEVMTEEWKEFLRFLAMQMSWDYIILDLGNLILKSYMLFDVMDEIYIPEIEDAMGKRKLRAFIEAMSAMGRGILLEKITYVKLPWDQEIEKYMDCGKIEQLEWSAMGSYARKFVNERSL